MSDSLLRRQYDEMVSENASLTTRLTAVEALLKDQDKQLRTWVRINEEHNRDFALMRQRAETAEQQRDALVDALQFYADEQNYYEHGAAFSRPRHDAVHVDKGSRARDLLLSSQREPQQQQPGDAAAVRHEFNRACGPITDGYHVCVCMHLIDGHWCGSIDDDPIHAESEAVGRGEGESGL